MKNILIIGTGRVGVHFNYYLSQLGFSVTLWSRRDGDQSLQRAIADSDVIMLAVPDDRIHEWNCKVSSYSEKKTVVFHFSGSYVENHCIDIHPLCSFGSYFFPNEFYRKITIVSSTKDAEFHISKFLPGLPNKIVTLPVQHKPLYHALNVLAGPGVMVLWKKYLREMEILGLPAQHCMSYFESLLLNISSHHDPVITGPWARKDHRTIERNREALKAVSLLELYDQLKSMAPEIIHEHT